MKNFFASLFTLLFTLLLSNGFTAQSVPPLMFSEMDGVMTLDDGTELPIWGYGLTSDGFITLPGPLLEYETGDNVNLVFSNPSAESHTIHLHGLDVDQANDGVPTTSFQVITGGTGAYSFTTSKPGTFLYHCHVTTTLHLTMGMYGMIIVRHPGGVLFEGGPFYHSDAPLLFSDLEIATNLAPVQSYPFHDIRPDYFMVNGRSGSQLDTEETILSCPAGESLALRLGSMAYSRTRVILPPELNAVCWMSDGRPVPTPFDVDTLDIFPGERYTVLVTPSTNYDGSFEVEYWDMVNLSYSSTNIVRVRDAALSINDPTTPTSTLQLQPNPSTHWLEASNSDSTPIGDWNIYNSSGKELLSGKSTSTTTRIDVHELLAGQYFFRVKVLNGATSSSSSPSVVWQTETFIKVD